MKGHARLFRRNNSLGALMVEAGQKRMSVFDRHCRSWLFVHDRARSCTVLGRATPFHAGPRGESVQGFRNERPIAITLATRNRLPP